MARRYQANGTPVAGEFQVNTRVLGYQYQPDPAYFSDGSAIIVWTSYNQDGSNGGVYGQRLDASGAKLGPEFNINSFTTGFQGRPSVAVAPDDSFGVIWQSDLQDGDNLGVFAQQFDAAGKRLGVELPVNNVTTGLQGAPHVTAQPNGQYVAVWDSPIDGDASSVAARLAGFPAVGPMLVDVPHDTVAEGGANLNGVLEPDEAASVEPSFTNHSDDSLPLSGTASNFRGLPGPTYTLIDTSADYGTITSGATFDCFLSTGELLFGDGLRHAPGPALGCGIRRDALVRGLHPHGGPARRRQLRRRAAERLLSLHRESLSQRRHGRMRDRILPDRQRDAGADGGLPAEGSMGIAVRSGAGDGDGVP